MEDNTLHNYFSLFKPNPEFEKKLKEANDEILLLLTKYLEENPKQRFGQALANLKINQFSNLENPEKDNFKLRNIYNDSSEKILERIKNN